MSARAKEFLDNWIQGVAVTGQTGGAGISIDAIREADEDGISEDELLEEAGGDLDSYITAALQGSRSDDDDDDNEDS